MSVVTTAAVSSRVTVPSVTLIAMGEPSTESADVRPTTWSEVTFPATRWYRRICSRPRDLLEASGSASRSSSASSGSEANGSSVGAKTVNGPPPC